MFKNMQKKMANYANKLFAKQNAKCKWNEETKQETVPFEIKYKEKVGLG